MLLHQDLIQTLKKDERLVVDGKLAKNKVVELALQLDADLLRLLRSSNDLSKIFFQKVDDVLVFDKVKFQSFVSNKEFLPDSFTEYKNKIGLVSDKHYLTDSEEVVLAFPYKDCVLEGGQSKEDAERNEIFWNETLAPDEIDRLLESKVLKNFKKYDSKGEHPVKDISLEDNLIIKGNNLIALHSLKGKYKGKIKLIYIDPPYNTGSDSFRYNDNFNHSTWLTFVKNRLQVARDLLTEDGVIFVHCDNNEQAYLKVLMDEVFGRENFLETITVVNNPRGRDYGALANMHEFICLYAKTPFYETYKLYDADKEFPFEDSNGGFETRELRNRNIKFNDGNRPNLFYSFWLNPKKKDKDGFYDISLAEEKGWIEVPPAKSQGVQTVWRWGKEKSQLNLNINIVGKDNQNGGYQIVEKYREKTRLARSVWWDKEVNSERGTLHLKSLFNNKKIFDFPKPEELLKRVLEIGSKENDIVLDFHLGSGTTASVAHKMGRKYIGIEQMEYVQNIPVERLIKVINGEKGGISEQVKWAGGGSFVYAELAEANQLFVERIQDAKNTKSLLSVWEEMKKTAFLSYKVKPQDIDATKKDFESLSFEDQQRFLISTLDKNLLYVPYSEIEDKTYAVSKEDIALNTEFYGRN